MGNIKTLKRNIEFLTGIIESITGNIEPLMGNIQPLMGNIEPLTGNIEPLTGMFCNQTLTKGINKSKLDTPANSNKQKQDKLSKTKI